MMTSFDCITFVVLSNPKDSVNERRIIREEIFSELRSHAEQFGLKALFIDPWSGLVNLDFSPCDLPLIAQIVLNDILQPLLKSGNPIFFIILLGDSIGPCPLPVKLTIDEFNWLERIALVTEEEGNRYLTTLYEPVYDDDNYVNDNDNEPKEYRLTIEPNLQIYYQTENLGAISSPELIEVHTQRMKCIQKVSHMMRFSPTQVNLWRELDELGNQSVPATLVKAWNDSLIGTICHNLTDPQSGLMKSRINSQSSNFQWLKTFTIFRQFYEVNIYDKALSTYHDLTQNKKKLDNRSIQLTNELKLWLQNHSLLQKQTFVNLQMKWLPGGLDPNSSRHKNKLTLLFRDFLQQAKEFLDLFINSREFHQAITKKLKFPLSNKHHLHYAQILQHVDNNHDDDDQQSSSSSSSSAPNGMKEILQELKDLVVKPCSHTLSISPDYVVTNIALRQQTVMELQNVTITLGNHVLPRLYELEGLETKTSHLSSVKDLIYTRIQFIRQSLASTNYAILLRGDYGSGKAIVLSHLSTLMNKTHKVISHFMRCDPVPDIQAISYAQLIRSLICDIVKTYKLPSFHPLLLVEEDDEFVTRMFELVLYEVYMIKSNTFPLLITIGELDHWQNLSNFLQNLHFGFPPGVSVIIAVPTTQIIRKSNFREVNMLSSGDYVVQQLVNKLNQLELKLNDSYFLNLIDNVMRQLTKDYQDVYIRKFLAYLSVRGSLGLCDVDMNDLLSLDNYLLVSVYGWSTLISLQTNSLCTFPPLLWYRLKSELLHLGLISPLPPNMGNGVRIRHAMWDQIIASQLCIYDDLKRRNAALPTSISDYHVALCDWLLGEYSTSGKTIEVTDAVARLTSARSTRSQTKRSRATTANATNLTDDEEDKTMTSALTSAKITSASKRTPTITLSFFRGVCNQPIKYNRGCLNRERLFQLPYHLLLSDKDVTWQRWEIDCLMNLSWWLRFLHNSSKPHTLRPLEEYFRYALQKYDKLKIKPRKVQLREEILSVITLLTEAMAETIETVDELPYWIICRVHHIKSLRNCEHLYRIIEDSEKCLKFTDEARFYPVGQWPYLLHRTDPSLLETHPINFKNSQNQFIQRCAYFVSDGTLLTLSYHPNGQGTLIHRRKVTTDYFVKSGGVRDNGLYTSHDKHLFIPYFIREIVGEFQNGRILVISYWNLDKTASRYVLYNWEQNKMIRDFGPQKLIHVHSGERKIVTFNPGELMLYDFDSDRSIQLEIPYLWDQLASLAFTRSGSRIVCACTNGAVFAWCLMGLSAISHTKPLPWEQNFFTTASSAGSLCTPTPTSKMFTTPSPSIINLTNNNTLINSSQELSLNSFVCLSGERICVTALARVAGRRRRGGAGVALIDLKTRRKRIIRPSHISNNIYDWLIVSTTEKVLIATSTRCDCEIDLKNKPYANSVVVFDLIAEIHVSVLPNVRQKCVRAICVASETNALIALSWNDDKARGGHLSIWQYGSSPGVYYPVAKCLRYICPPGLGVETEAPSSSLCLLEPKTMSVLVSCDEIHGLLHIWWWNQVERQALSRHTAIMEGERHAAWVKEEDAELARISATTGLAYINEVQVLGVTRSSGWWYIYRINANDEERVVSKFYEDGPLNHLILIGGRMFCFASRRIIYLWNGMNLTEMRQLNMPDNRIILHLISGSDRVLVVSKTYLFNEEDQTSSSLSSSAVDARAEIYNIKDGNQLCNVDLANVVAMADFASDGNFIASHQESLPLVFELGTSGGRIAQLMPPGWQGTWRKDVCVRLCFSCPDNDASDKSLNSMLWLAAASLSVIRILLIDPTEASVASAVWRLRIPRRYRQDFSDSHEENDCPMEHGLMQFLSVHSDGNVFLFVAIGSHMFLWSMRTGQLERCVQRHHATIISVCQSPDHSFLITGAKDHYICVWDCHAWACVCTIPVFDVLPQYLCASLPFHRLFIASTHRGLSAQPPFGRLDANEAFRHMRAGVGRQELIADKRNKTVLTGVNARIIPATEKFTKSAQGVTNAFSTRELDPIHSVVCSLM